MISDTENESKFLGISMGKLTNGVNLLVILVSIGFIAFIVMVVLLMKYRSKKSKKKNSICEESVESGVLSPNTKRMKLTRSEAKSSSDNSDSSDDVLYEKNERYVTDRVQPKRHSLRSQQSVSSVDSEMDTIPTLVLSVTTDEKYASVALIKAKNLRRSGYSANDKLIPEGVFARIYPTSRSVTSEGSHSEDEPQRQTCDEYFETTLIKSKKSKLIKFNDKEKFDVFNDNFPIRISIYEYDKQRVRYNIGHCFLNINTRDNYHTKQLIELNLYTTLYKAKSAAHAQK
ncbi:unnamed protein product [Oppiella nova]|nr:unnamed protein product [Oppiella nova]CAG2164217.1 unnamed protein product [Oppiella nova]